MIPVQGDRLSACVNLITSQNAVAQLDEKSISCAFISNITTSYYNGGQWLETRIIYRNAVVGLNKNNRLQAFCIINMITAKYSSCPNSHKK